MEVSLNEKTLIFMLLFILRYLQPPNQWVKAALESRELLSVCLKKLRGLSKVCACVVCLKYSCTAQLTFTSDCSSRFENCSYYVSPESNVSLIDC